MKCPYLLMPVLLLSVVGCCTPWEQPQPIKPANVKGWESYRQGTLKVLGNFVLNEGQSVQSDSLGIEILKISPLKTCLGRFQEPPDKTATLKIYRPADKFTLCEATIGEDSGLLPCERGKELPYVTVHGINTKERWVSLALVESAVESAP